MRKLLLVFMFALLFSSCNEKGRNYQIKYRIYYPGNTVEKVVYSADTPYLTSHRGTNHLAWTNEKGSYVGVATTAPIEVVFVKKLK